MLIFDVVFIFRVIFILKFSSETINFHRTDGHFIKIWGKIWPEVHWWCEMKSNYAVQWLARSHDVSSVNLENLHMTERKLHSQVVGQP